MQRDPRLGVLRERAERESGLERRLRFGAAPGGARDVNRVTELSI